MGKNLNKEKACTMVIIHTNNVNGALVLNGNLNGTLNGKVMLTPKVQKNGYDRQGSFKTEQVTLKTEVV